MRVRRNKVQAVLTMKERNSFISRWVSGAVIPGGRWGRVLRGGSSFLPRGGGGVDPVADPGFSKNRAVLLFSFFFLHLVAQGGGGVIPPNPLDPPLVPLPHPPGKCEKSANKNV